MDCTGHLLLGEHALRVSARIPGDTVLACEPAFATAALQRALELRRSGTHFALSVYTEDHRSRRMRERSAELCALYPTWDEVRLLLDQTGASLGSDRATLPDPERAALYETIRLADTIIARSWGEHGRLVEAAGKVRRDVDIVVNADPDVPANVTGTPTDVVVYGPHYRADELGAYVTALCDLQVPVTIVARDRPTIESAVRFELPAGAAAALGRARVIVDATGNDPGVAVALARLGRPLAVSSVGGATEMLRGARSYDVWERRSILTAAVNGLGAEAPTIHDGRWDERPRSAAPIAFGADEPLVSVIVATCDRPELLAGALASIERQTYPTLEIIVVNDGGAPVGEVAARSPRARVIERAENGGPAAARNAGLREARGTFVMFFDDDDEMFPDHVAAHVGALQRSGLDVAYGQMVNALAAPATANARYAFVGHTAVLDHADIQWAGSIAPTAVMFRRTLVDRIGLLDESLTGAEDYDFWLRLAEGREWARVSAVTSMYTIRNDGSHYSAKLGRERHLTAHATIYQKHPSARPLVQAGRASMLRYFQQDERIDQRYGRA